MDIVLAQRMIAAEVLKLRRNRPVMIVTLLLTVGVIALYFIVSAIQHSSNPLQNGPAGGDLGFSRSVRLLGVYFGSLAAALVGSEAGTADISSGVFRDLVATGRSRLTLFWVRLPAALIVSVGFTALAYALGVIGLFVYADGLITPSSGRILDGLGWVLLATGAVTALALGLGCLTGSRTLTLTGLIGWQTVGQLLLVHEIRNPVFLLSTGLARFAPTPVTQAHLSELAAAWVIAAWILVPILAGARRTLTQDV